MGLGKLMKDTDCELKLILAWASREGTVCDTECNHDASAKYLGRLFNIYHVRVLKKKKHGKLTQGL